MNAFAKQIAKTAYNKIKENKVTESAIFSTIEMYIRRPMTERQKHFVRFYIEKIKRGEMSFDEYWTLLNEKIAPYEEIL